MQPSCAAKNKHGSLAVAWNFALIGLVLIGFLQLQYIKEPLGGESQIGSEVSRRLREMNEDIKKEPKNHHFFPYRSASRAWGKLHSKNLPRWTRKLAYKSWSALFNCNLDEMKYPLKDYKNLGEFFSRPLKDGARPIDPNTDHIVSPVDGKVLSTGFVNDSTVPMLRQIKGSSYQLDELLGSIPSFFTEQTTGKNIYYCVMYLAPGDYHRVHSPVDWQIETRRHFPGNLHPVNARAVASVPNLYLVNERVVLSGEWEHGYFSLTAVGALNVGSILITKEPEFRTNVAAQDELIGQCLTKNYSDTMETTRGEELAQFKLGSTVVLVFEAPDSFQFAIASDEKLIMGKSIGSVK